MHVINQESVNPASSAEETLPVDASMYEDVEFDIDSLKDQLGIRKNRGIFVDVKPEGFGSTRSRI